MGSETRTAAQTENVLIRAGDCAVTVLPEIGGKISSIRVGERELLQSPLAPIERRDSTMGFDESDASGWDECLPSVAACTVQLQDGIAVIADHGSVWRTLWTDVSNGSNRLQSIALATNCLSLTLFLERTLSLNETERGWKLSLLYGLNNTGSIPMPWSWAAHPLFGAEPGDRIVLPDAIHKLRLEGSGGERLGKGGDAVAWPVATLANGASTDLSIAASPDSKIGDKLFAGPLAQTENWCELVRPSAGVRIRVTFDTAATPYLGLWICYGGWPEKPGPKQVCVAMEPSTAPVDSLAVTGPWSRVLAPGEWFSWGMEVQIERIER